jgi:fructokinase
LPGSAHSGALVVGESLVDVTRAGNETFAYPGGSPLNVAVGMARLGVPTTLATQIGRDAYGELIRSHLGASAVALIELGPPGPTGTATAQLAADGSAAYTFDLR